MDLKQGMFAINPRVAEGFCLPPMGRQQGFLVAIALAQPFLLRYPIAIGRVRALIGCGFVAQRGQQRLHDGWREEVFVIAGYQQGLRLYFWRKMLEIEVAQGSPDVIRFGRLGA